MQWQCEVQVPYTISMSISSPQVATSCENINECSFRPINNFDGVNLGLSKSFCVTVIIRNKYVLRPLTGFFGDGGRQKWLV